MLKSERERLYHISWILWRKFSWKKFLLVYAKSKNCLLSHWLLMTSMLFSIETIYCKIFRCNYLENEKPFLFFSHFRNLDSILDIFEEKMTFIDCLWTHWLLMTNIICLIETISSNYWGINGLKHCWNLNESTITIFLDHCEGSSVWKNYSEWYAKS